MTEGSKKRNRQLAFELQNSHVYEKRSKAVDQRKGKYNVQSYGIPEFRACSALNLAINILRGWGSSLNFESVFHSKWHCSFNIVKQTIFISQDSRFL